MYDVSRGVVRRAARRAVENWWSIMQGVWITLLGIRQRHSGSIRAEVEFRQLLDAEDTDSEDLHREEWAMVRYAHLRD